jgi:hypothetical protein
LPPELGVRFALLILRGAGIDGLNELGMPHPPRCDEFPLLPLLGIVWKRRLLRRRSHATRRLTARHLPARPAATRHLTAWTCATRRPSGPARARLCAAGGTG